MSLREFLLLGLILLIGSLAVHPLQFPLIQLLEGYWSALPFGGVMSELLTKRYRDYYWSLRTRIGLFDGTDPAEVPDDIARARVELDWLPREENQLLPTSLGNTLRAGESQAGLRYGLEIAATMRRLLPLLSQQMSIQLSDQRNQLDAAARLCVAALATVPFSILLLYRWGTWLWLPVVLYGISWLCYRAAVAAARGYCRDLAAAVDLHHLDLYAALHLSIPTDLADELERNKILRGLLGGKQPAVRDRRKLTYEPVRRPSG